MQAWIPAIPPEPFFWSLFPFSSPRLVDESVHAGDSANKAEWTQLVKSTTASNAHLCRLHNQLYKAKENMRDEKRNDAQILFVPCLILSIKAFGRSQISNSLRFRWMFLRVSQQSLLPGRVFGVLYRHGLSSFTHKILLKHVKTYGQF